MTTRIAGVVAYASLALFSTGSAAEPSRAAPAPESGFLPPFEAVTVTRSRGLVPLGRPVLRGRTYVLTAVDRGGIEVRVVVDARAGDIVAIDPLVAPPPPGTRRSDAAFASARRVLPPDFAFFVNPPRPPRIVPGGARSPTLDRGATVTPLPRPRPADATPAAVRSTAADTPAARPANNTPATRATDTPMQGFE